MPGEDRRSDGELLAATATDARAFAVFYRRHVSAVLAYLLSRTGRPELAADICAEVFARALETRSRYDESRGAARSWLLSMAWSRLVDAARRGAVEDRARKRLGMPVLELSDSDLERIEELLDPRLALAEQLLAGLPAEQRDAIRSRVLEERDYADIAASVECSEHVIRKRVSRGLTALRNQLAEHNQLAQESSP
jgi:RNA polymerase sigma factor (sigma-70 family)